MPRYVVSRVIEVTIDVVLDAGSPEMALAIADPTTDMLSPNFWPSPGWEVRTARETTLTQVCGVNEGDVEDDEPLIEVRG